MNRTLWAEARAIAARHGRTEPDDLAQELVVVALEAGAHAERPGAWLERVGRNAAIDRWRVDARRAELAGQIESPAPPPDPETALLGHERRQLVRRALASLPRPQRRAALARYHGALSFDEIAARLGTEPITARTRVHRALAALRERLGGLRAMFVLPGAHAAALGVALLVIEGPALAPRPPTERVVADASEAARPPGSRRAAREARPEVAAPSPPSAATTAVREAQRAPGRPSPAATSSSAPPAPIPSPQTFVFDDDDVEGGVVGPEGEVIIVVHPVAEPSLIELRRHFVAEVVKSMEEL